MAWALEFSSTPFFSAAWLVTISLGISTIKEKVAEEQPIMEEAKGG